MALGAIVVAVAAAFRVGEHHPNTVWLWGGLVIGIFGFVCIVAGITLQLTASPGKHAAKGRSISKDQPGAHRQDGSAEVVDDEASGFPSEPGKTAAA
jgi:hypothetical protein